MSKTRSGVLLRSLCPQSVERSPHGLRHAAAPPQSLKKTTNCQQLTMNNVKFIQKENTTKGKSAGPTAERCQTAGFENRLLLSNHRSKPFAFQQSSVLKLLVAGLQSLFVMLQGRQKRGRVPRPPHLYQGLFPRQQTSEKLPPKASEKHQKTLVLRSPRTRLMRKVVLQYLQCRNHVLGTPSIWISTQ